MLKQNANILGANMKQCTQLESIETFTIQPNKGKKFTIKKGCILMVTSPSYGNIDGCLIDKTSKAMINSGYYFTNEQISNMFKVIE